MWSPILALFRYHHFLIIWIHWTGAERTGNGITKALGLRATAKPAGLTSSTIWKGNSLNSSLSLHSSSRDLAKPVRQLCTTRDGIERATLRPAGLVHNLLLLSEYFLSAFFALPIPCAFSFTCIAFLFRAKLPRDCSSYCCSELWRLLRDKSGNGLACRDFYAFMLFPSLLLRA